VTTDNDKNIEIEIKIKIHDLNQTREKILNHGFTIIEADSLEHNIVFDTPDQQLKQKHFLLRLRKKNDQTILTVKRPGKEFSYSSQYKVREEIEVEVSDYDNAQTIIQALGYDIFFIYEKHREVFQDPSGQVKIMIDHTPIGDFIEIEGSAVQIDRIASELGYSPADYITANYYSLYRQKHKTGHMQFK
jgi:adenylate cyclase class 2